MEYQYDPENDKNIVFNMREQYKKKFIVLDEHLIKEEEKEEEKTDFKLEQGMASDDEEIVIKFNKKELKKMIAEQFVKELIEKIKL